MYPLNTLLNGGNPSPELLSTLVPNALTIPDPDPLVFPRAPTYTLSGLDHRYRRGYIYSTPISLTLESKKEETERLYKIATPPGVRPRGFNPTTKQFIMGPVEGMIQMPPGVPFVVNIDGDEERYITVACLQTPQSLRNYSEWPSIQRYLNEVTDLTWGTATTKPIYLLDGTKLNLRSQGEKEDRADGSASHGITVEEYGAGYVQPAAQAVTDEAVILQLKLMTRLAALYALIVPLCVSKQEWEARKFRNEDVNALCCGQVNSGFSGVQKNVSSSSKGGSLVKSLDINTGAWHTDADDDPVGETLIIAVFRLPPGE